MQNKKVEGIMENIRLQKDVHGILNEVRAPKKAKTEPVKEEPKPEPESAPNPETQTQAQPQGQNQDLVKGIDDLFALLQEYAASLQGFYAEIKNGAESLKTQILDAVKNEMQNQQIQGGPTVNPATKKATVARTK